MTPPAERQKRFQAIATAYDALRGKAKFEGGRTYRSSSDDPFEEELMRRSSAYWAHPSRQAGYAAQQQAEGAQKEGMTMRDRIVISLGALVTSFLLQYNQRLHSLPFSVPPGWHCTRTHHFPNVLGPEA